MKTKQENKEILISEKSTIVKIPDDINNIIKYTCSKLQTREWTGTLFAKKESNEFHVVDIFIRSLGTSGTAETSKKEEELMQKYQRDTFGDDFFNIYQLDIHSHNKMDAFFSGTDQTDFLKRANATEHISIVTNNKNDYFGKHGIPLTLPYDTEYPIILEKRVKVVVQYTVKEQYIKRLEELFKIEEENKKKQKSIYKSSPIPFFEKPFIKKNTNLDKKDFVREYELEDIVSIIAGNVVDMFNIDTKPLTEEYFIDLCISDFNDNYHTISKKRLETLLKFYYSVYITTVKLVKEKLTDFADYNNLIMLQDRLVNHVTKQLTNIFNSSINVNLEYFIGEIITTILETNLNY